MDRRKFLGTSMAALVTASAGALSCSQKLGTTDEEEQLQKLKLRFLGTGAADWNGRDSRGELRRWTSILLDDSVLVDYTLTNSEMMPQGCRPEVIFYTHSHPDHYNPKVALQAGVKRVYCGSTWFDDACDDFSKQAKALNVEMPEITALRPGDAISECGMTLTALPANHATDRSYEQSLMYLVEKGKVRLLYATDTGGIPAIAARLAGIDKHVASGKGITALVMEATMGMDHGLDYRMFTHSSVDDVIRLVKLLTNTSRYKPRTGQKVYITHMARTLHGPQAELDALLPSPLKAAYDGLEVEFE